MSARATQYNAIQRNTWHCIAGDGGGSSGAAQNRSELIAPFPFRPRTSRVERFCLPASRSAVAVPSRRASRPATGLGHAKQTAALPLGKPPGQAALSRGQAAFVRVGWARTRPLCSAGRISSGRAGRVQSCRLRPTGLSLGPRAMGVVAVSRAAWARARCRQAGRLACPRAADVTGRN